MCIKKKHPQMLSLYTHIYRITNWRWRERERIIKQLNEYTNTLERLAESI